MNQMCFYHVKRAVLCCFNISLAYLVLSLRVNRCDIIGMFLVWPGYTFLFFNSPSGMGFLSFSVILSYIILFIILLILGFRFIMGIRWGRQKQRHWTVRLPSTTACCAWSSACPELYNPDLASSKDNTLPLLVLPSHPFYLVHWSPGPHLMIAHSLRCSLQFSLFIYHPSSLSFEFPESYTEKYFVRRCHATPFSFPSFCPTLCASLPMMKKQATIIIIAIMYIF